MINLPYSSEALRNSLRELEEQFDENPALQAKMEEKFGSVDLEDRIIEHCAPKETNNATIAEFHGISVLDLINSPNYPLLITQYQLSSLEKGVKFLSEEIGLTELQTWALVAVGMGLIN